MSLVGSRGRRRSQLPLVEGGALPRRSLPSWSTPDLPGEVLGADVDGGWAGILY